MSGVSVDGLRTLQRATGTTSVLFDVCCGYWLLWLLVSRVMSPALSRLARRPAEQ